MCECLARVTWLRERADDSLTDDALSCFPEQTRRAGVIPGGGRHALMVCDTRCRVVWVNASFSRITGYSARDLIRPDRVFGHSPYRLAISYYLVITLSARVWRGRLVGAHRDGPRFLASTLIRYCPGHDLFGPCFIVSFIPQDPDDAGDICLSRYMKDGTYGAGGSRAPANGAEG